MHAIITEVFFALLVFSRVANSHYGQYDGEIEENDRKGTERFFGPPFGGGFGGRPHAPQFEGPQGSQFGGPESHFKGPQFGAHHHGGPPGSQHGGGHAWYPNGGGPHENSKDEEIDDEEMIEGIDLPLVASKVVNTVLLLLRPMLIQALTTELIAQGLDIANAHVHLPAPHPGFLPGPAHQHYFQNPHQQDLDVSLTKRKRVKRFGWGWGFAV